ncbi:MAG: tetratricopeptide repeat protein [Elainellaceae cyanobacterium]
MHSSLDNALKRYESVLAELEIVEQPSARQILNVLLARDGVQQAIARGDSSNVAVIIMLFTLDQKLRGVAGKIRGTIELEDWRSSYPPAEEAWWWFLDSRPKLAEAEGAVARYKAKIALLEEADSKTIQQDVEHSAVEFLAKVFTVRDAVQAEIEADKVSPNDLMTVANLDERLRQQIDRFSRILDSKTLQSLTDKFEELRYVLKPPDNAWWWFLKMPAHWWDRYDPVWTVLTLFWLTGTFGLLTDISTRFLGGGGPGTFGALAVIFQSILALIGGSAITQRGNAIVERTLTRWRVPKRLWQEMKFGAATVLLLTFVGFRLSLPRIAVGYNNSAIEDYVVGNLDSAESKLKRALELDPNYVRAHYNLGVVYEDLGKLDEAQVQYNLAVAGGFIPAYNNQARLSILSEDYPNAVNFLTRGISLAKSNDTDETPGNNTNPVVEHDLWKNLGWARFKQGYYSDAEESLRTAIEIADNNDSLKQEAATFCLLAQTFEKLGNQPDANVAWQDCLSNPRNPNNPEEDEWQQMSRERLKP